LLVWPPYNKDMAFRVAKATNPGQHLIYVGEDSGGCTGCQRFHKLLASQFIEELAQPLPQWPGLHDWFYLYRRRISK